MYTQICKLILFNCLWVLDCSSLNAYLSFDITSRNNSNQLMDLSAALPAKCSGCFKGFSCTDYNTLIIIFRLVSNLKCFAASENCYIISYMPLHIFYSASISPKQLLEAGNPDENVKTSWVFWLLTKNHFLLYPVILFSSCPIFHLPKLQTWSMFWSLTGS